MYQYFVITEKGLELRQRVMASGNGGNGLSIRFTRGALGVGRPDLSTDVHCLPDLIDYVMDVPVKENYASGVSHVITIVISNKDFAEELLLTEIGVFAQLEDAVTGEVVAAELLYGYTYTDTYDYIPVPVNHLVYREIFFNTTLSKGGNFKVTFDGDKVFVTHKDLQNVFGDVFNLHELSLPIEHYLNTYPKVLVIEFDYGYGMGGCGEGGYGGSNGRKLRNSVEYLDRNSIKISVEKQYNLIEDIIPVSRYEHIITFVDSTLSLRVLLLAGNNIMQETDRSYFYLTLK